ncbi:NADH-quinone oxidoreductase subunit C [Streptomyces sp. MNP-20]|uniref:NADH-quinone oxidoreductase subunit C n=1 Tax=Streptomyces sp. MNP-20 TaxID=2721165 RepID=UPI0020A683B3|nr:NADH-quinone oxidoreductase subunit C [Streptomyces sp. MNP-20]
MTGWLSAPVEELFGAEATAEESYDLLTVDVPSASWPEALRTARSTLGCTYFDWLSAVDEPGTGFRVSCHVVALSPVRRLLVRTTVPHEAPVLPSAVDVYAGAAWHERETHEMFGVRFEGHPHLVPLLLPENFEGHPLRKDFVLAARVAKAWPGAKEPGESEHGGPKRRQMLPPGVPDPNEWGPLKGQLPAAPARPARGAGRAAAAGERPARRTRTASAGSASQSPAPAADAPATDAPAADQAPAPARPPRRARSVSQGSASQRTAAQPPAPADAAQPPEAPGPDAPAPAAPAPDKPQPAPRASDAPWHHARPAFDTPKQEPERKPRTAPAEAPAPAEPLAPAETTENAETTETTANEGDSGTTGDDGTAGDSGETGNARDTGNARGTGGTRDTGNPRNPGNTPDTGTEGGTR